MKIWCCLCFTVDDNDRDNHTMKDGIDKVEDALEGNLGNGDDMQMQLGPALDMVDTQDRNEQLSAMLLDETIATMSGSVAASSSGTSWRPVVLGQRRHEGESSSSLAGGSYLDDDDLQHKRAKVYSASSYYHYAAAVSSASAELDRDNRMNLGTLVLSNGETIYRSLLWNNGGSENPFDECSGKVVGSESGVSSASAGLDRDYMMTPSTSVLSNSETIDRSLMWNNGGFGNPFDEGSGKVVGSDSGVSKTEDTDVRMDLSDDLLHMVLSFLDYADLCRAAMVCRQWRAASAHEDFWRCLNFENRQISLEQFEDVCRRYPNATEVIIYGTPAIHMLVMKAVSSLRNLEAITLGKGVLEDAFFNALTDCSMLKSLSINDCTLGGSHHEIPINHDRLRHLEITKCRVMRISIRCPQLQHLSLKRSNMVQAVLICPLLNFLDIASCHKLSDAAVRLAATSCPQLESLDMSNCSCVTDETLREIALNCVNLRVLNSSYCPNISLESVMLPMLTVLKLHYCEGITSASMAAIANSSMLEVLELINCNLLTTVSLDLPRLQNIRLVQCRKFTDLNLRTVMLSSIVVSNCAALHRINITSNSLQKLALQKQENLKTLTLQCQCLQEVDLTDCESLTNSICDIFSDGGGCPMLKSLVLDNCEGLTVVRFCSTSLVSLSLVGCRGITALELICPSLEIVSLDGCDHLERAYFNPVALQSLNLGICPKLNTLNIEALHMVVLELKGCGVLSEATINCPLLTSLDASFCSQLKDECLSATASSCPLIESLILMSCPSIGSDGLYSLCSLPNLTMLDLSYTFLTNLHPVFESCLQLKVLKLQACKYLSDSSLEPLYKNNSLPALRELDLSYGTLCQSAIEELLACCMQLTHVSLNGCVNMHDLNWDPSSAKVFGQSGEHNSYKVEDSMEQPNRLLQNLNCVGCPNIRKVLIPPQAHCFNLSSLNLSLSVNLREVDVACFNLCFLNLSNCCSLENLKLACPKLTSLFLQSCNIDEEAVETAISQCTMLETLDVRFCPKISSVSMGKFRAACLSLKRIFSSLTPS